MRDFFVFTVKAIENSIAELEPQIARAKVENTYDFGRLQGKLDGLDAALEILEKSYKDDLDDN